MTMATRATIVALSIAVVTAGGSATRADTADLDCVMQPREVVTVNAPVEGVLERVAVDRGDVVQAGSLLAMLESSLERNLLAVARARATQDSAVEANEGRQDFEERRFLRVDEPEQILAGYRLMDDTERKRLADSDLERAEAALALRAVKSPITGVVMERLRRPGELASPEHPIMTIAALDPLRVDVVVPVALFGRVVVGQRAVVVPATPHTRRLEATVIEVDKVADATSSTFGVRLEASNPGHRVPGGLTCKVRVGR